MDLKATGLGAASVKDGALPGGVTEESFGVVGTLAVSSRATTVDGSASKGVTGAGADAAGFVGVGGSPTPWSGPCSTGGMSMGACNPNAIELSDGWTGSCDGPPSPIEKSGSSVGLYTTRWIPNPASRTVHSRKSKARPAAAFLRIEAPYDVMMKTNDWSTVLAVFTGIIYACPHKLARQPNQIERAHTAVCVQYDTQVCFDASAHRAALAIYRKRAKSQKKKAAPVQKSCALLVLHRN